MSPRMIWPAPAALTDAAPAPMMMQPLPVQPAALAAWLPMMTFA